MKMILTDLDIGTRMGSISNQFLNLLQKLTKVLNRKNILRLRKSGIKQVVINKIWQMIKNHL